jgi:hypothetical protein
MDHGPCYRTHVRSPWSRSPADLFEVSINRVTSGTFVIAPLTGHFAIALLYPDLQSFFFTRQPGTRPRPPATQNRSLNVD